MPKNYHLFLKGQVGSPWYGNFTSDMVDFILDKHKDSVVNVLINSLGGYTHEALTISSLFKIHGNVHVHFIGQSASAATIAAMGAKKITIDADAMFLVHRCSSLVLEWSMMNAEQIDEFIAKLEKQKQDQSKIDIVVANLYARRCKKSQQDLLQLMKKDTWLTAHEALDWGFVDEITDDDEDKQPISDATAAEMSSAGIPLPPGFKHPKGSLINRFLEFLKSSNNYSTPKLINSSTPTPQTTPDNMNTETSTTQDLTAEIESLKEQIAERDRTIAELRKQPAAPTSDVIDSKTDEPDPYAPVSQADAIEASKAFIKNFN